MVQDLPEAHRDLLTDDAVTTAARRQADKRPELDAASQKAIDQRAQMRPDASARPDEPAYERAAGNAPETSRDAPEANLWAALSTAPADGISVPALMAATGMGRRWVYYRLRSLADAGQVTHTERGNWRACHQHGDSQ